MEKADKPPVYPEIKRRIQELIALSGGGYNPDIVEDVIANGLKMLKDVKSRGDARVIQTALRELRYAFRLFEPYSGTRKVTIFGSARIEPTVVEYRQAVEFARKSPRRVTWSLPEPDPVLCKADTKGRGPR